MAGRPSSQLDRTGPNRLRAGLLAGSAFLALCIADPARAQDVAVNASTSTGVDLDASAGNTAEVASGVTVTNAALQTAIRATTRAWTVTNRGSVTGTQANAISLAFAGSSVINLGSVTATSSNAITLNGGGSVDNQAGGMITASNSAVVIGTTSAGPGTFSNAGTITQTGTAGDLVQLRFGGTATNLAGGIISANNNSNALSVGQGASRTVVNSGTITNTGTGFAAGVLVQGGPSTVTNTVGGRISGTFNGVYASATGILTFANAGLIESTGAGASTRAVEGTGGGTFVNTGTIQSASGEGLFLGRAGTVTNSGTIKGATRAINFSGNFARTLNLDTGSVLSGTVQGGTGVDDLVLLGTGSEDIAKFLGFETLAMQGSAWTLSGNGGFATGTSVQSGTLAVSGTLTSPTMTVASGATLAGTGTLAAATTVANGGMLAGASGGGLDFSSLALNGTSQLNLALGAPSTAALFNVTGALTLDGLLSVTNGGGFALGTYRLFNYGGALTDNGLTIQSLPAGFNPGDWSIATAAAGEVDLTVAAGPGEQYWDGPFTAPGNVANGRSGTAIWNTTSTNWTNQAGSINAPWAGGTAVIITGSRNAAGACSNVTQPIITLDAGGISATGLRSVAACGGVTRLAGGTLTLADDAELRGFFQFENPVAALGDVLQGDNGSSLIDQVQYGNVATIAGTYAVQGSTLVVSRYNFAGATFAQARLTIGGALSIDPTGAFAAQFGGQMFSQGGVLNSTGSLIVGGLWDAGAGDIVVGGSANGALSVGGTTFFSSGGSGYSTKNGEIKANRIVLGQQLGVTGNLALRVGGDVFALQPGLVGLTQVGGTNDASYTGTITAGSVFGGAGGGLMTFNGFLTANRAQRRANPLTFTPTLTGNLGVKIDAAEVHLTGTHNYTGATTITNDGLFFLDGATLANTEVTVTNGVFGGSGTIGGAVSLAASNSALSGRSGQLLTVGSLMLGAQSLVDVALGPPSTAALFNVNGALTLDGLLSVSNAGGFALGTYRLFNYGGALTNNGLTIQTLPQGFNPGDWSIDTATNGQVNLLAAAGPGEQYWDGANMTPGGIANGRGGTGTWNAGNTNWTNQAGSINAPWAGGTAIFGPCPNNQCVTSLPGGGTSTSPAYRVTIDPAGISAQGLRTLDVDVTIGGGALALTDAGIEVVQTSGTRALNVDSPISAAGNLAKTGLGSLFLSAATQVTGGLNVEGVMMASGVPATLAVGGAVSVGGAGSNAFPHRLLASGGARLTSAGGSVGGAADTAGSIFIQRGGSWDAGANIIEVGASGVGVLRVYSSAPTAVSEIKASQIVLGRNAGGNGKLQIWGDATAGVSDGIVTAQSVLGGAGGGNVEFDNRGAGAGYIFAPTLTGNLSATFLSGSTTLQAVHDYTGATTINGGTLALAAASLTGTAVTVTRGTLAGSGTIGGAVTFAATNTTLRGQSGQALAMASLALGSQTAVNLALGAPSSTALFDVTGALTLDGLLSVSDGGGFALGTYRLFDYGGALTDNGLTIQSLPTGFNPGDWSIDTATGGQVDLAVAQGPGEQYWDGANMSPGGVANGRGGTGTWNAANTNWTNQAGTINAPWASQMAVFKAAPGTSAVTVQGAQTVTGMRFLAGGTYGFTGTGSLAIGSGATPLVTEDQATTVDIGVAITGAGGIAKSGAGRLTLSGSNTYSGPTSVDAGTLLVDGTLANGATVASGASLGGSGMLGGATTVASGGVLLGTSGSDLGFGSLALADASLVNVTLGAPGNAALFGVTDALTLDGLLGVSAGAGFGLGTYRLFDYGGALTDNGLVIQSAPAGFNPGDWAIDTASAGQVNLIVAQGNGSQYWDGANLTPGGLANGRGGTGTWNAGNTNWTNQAGTINAAWASQKAVFTGSGTVTVVGQQVVTGLSFLAAADYGFVAGAAGGLVVNGGQASVALDQGTTASLGVGVSGTGGLAKSGAGTLILAGANSYAGGTTVSAGTLQVASGGNLTGDVTLASGASLVFDRSDASYGGAIAGAGALTKRGTGTLTLTGNSGGFAGTTTVQTGALVLDGSLGGAIAVGSGGQLGGAGLASSIADVAAGGVLAGRSGTVLTLGGLNLAPGATITAALGAPGTMGLFRVNGNLVLDGTVNITDAGGYGLGVYRLIDYGGGLTDNGLAVGSRPLASSTTVTVQTSQAAQVNLVVAAATGPDFIQFWNGSAVVPTGRVEGGNGTWTAGPVTNWTNANGTANFAWNGGFAVFQGAAGTVAVDGAGVSAQGLQFAVDGYRLTGGPVTLAGSGLATLRVGDGSAAGTGYRATIDSALTGSGGLDKQDLGTLTLAGANTYSGGTRVSAGTLRITGSVAGNIANEASLVFDRADTATFAGVISGSGALTKAGAGTLVLTGTSTYTGATTVAAGTLTVNGAIAGSAVTVNAGATLAGHGPVGSTAVFGTVSPSSPLLVNGNYTQAAGSTYAWQPGDVIVVSGTATLLGGRVQATNGASGLRLGERTAILTAAGGRTGTFAGIDLSTPIVQPFLTLGLTYDATSAYVQAVRSATTFASTGGTPNQRAAASGVDGLAQTSEVVIAVANLPDVAAARRSFDALSGEIHATLKGVLLDESRYLRDAVQDRLAQTAGADGMGLWVQALGGKGDADSDGNAAALDRSGWGWLFGFDAALGSGLRAGLTAGFKRSRVDVDDRASLAKIDSFHLGTYAGGRWGGTSLKAGLTYSWNQIATRRTVGFTGFGERAEAHYDGEQLQLFAEAAQRVALGQAALEPFAGIAWARLKTDHFIEQGGAAALRAAGQSETAAWTTLGLRGEAPVGGRASIYGSAAWRHTLSGRVAEADLAFAGGAPFTVFATPIDKDAAALSAGVAFRLPGDAMLRFGYAGTIGSATSDHGGRASLSIRF